MKKNRTLLATAAITAALALSACSGPADEDTGPDAGTPSTGATDPTAATSTEPATTTPSPEPTTATPEPVGPSFAVTVKGTKVGPNAQELSAAPGETITIDFDTDRAGQLHVHSKPEQYVDFPAGTSAKKLVIKTPGTVEIEEHDSEAVVAVVTVK
ncbi:hypothetical protein [Nocardioides daphniae]|uniref:EfeO-type cupredoxin-like domain-containing protein n=1 Tax=Nocardioides daphniae TaxID=402297 RepID=A0A4P7U9S1_9ACTN|nr:hypothetical protein [Nocardioides daphniae]QCC76025.1 hypothetical protein E2C04_00340 [Nocardioides daphniae]GGD11033.1 hypothetical protein GCM10007231_07210 [Nocardioides daphniae]